MNKATRYYRCLCFSLPVAVIALLLFCFLPCPSVNAAPILRLSLSSGPVGTSVTVTGTVFDSYEGDSIHILFDTTEIENSPVVVPADGSFVMDWVVPANAASGIHTIGAKRETTDSSFFISAPFTVDARLLTLSSSEGPVGTNIVISGSGFYIDEQVNISYFNPSAINVDSVTATHDGKINKAYLLPASTAGIHKFTAANARGNTAEAAFKVVPGLILSVDSGAPGEIITIKGSGFGQRGNINISLDTLSVAVTAADDFGSFETNLTIPEITRATHALTSRDNFGNQVEVVFPVIAGATLSQTTGPIGNPVTLNGDGFRAFNVVTVFYDDQPVGTATADAEGKFTVTFTIPVSNGGEHIVSISDSTTTRRYVYNVETTAPPSPVPLQPVSKDIASAFTLFQWQPVIDPSTPVTYNLEIASDDQFSSIVLTKNNIPEAQIALTEKEALKADIPASIYYWRVMAIDGAGNQSGWSAASSFIVGVPTAPVLLAPISGLETGFPISMSWGPSASLSEPVTYSLQVSRNNEFTELLIDDKTIPSTVYTIPLESQRIFNKKIPYYWRVKAIDNALNTSPWSASSSFNIESSGFPAWAIYTLVALAAVILALLTFRFVRRKRYH